MLRLGNLISLVLISLASALPVIERVKTTDALAGALPDMRPAVHTLGDFSYVVVSTLLGASAEIEGAGEESWKCWLEFGVPPAPAAEWLHSTDLVCSQGPEDYIWPLGEGIFRPGFEKNKVLMQGEAGAALARIIEKKSDPSDVESPNSSRVTAWGPNNHLRISTLRRSADEGNLQPSVECYTDENLDRPLSCGLQTR